MATLFSPEQIDYLSGIFVRQKDCDDRHDAQDKEIEDIKMQLTKVLTLLNIVLKVLGFVAGGIGTLLIGAIGALILR